MNLGQVWDTYSKTGLGLWPCSVSNSEIETARYRSIRTRRGLRLFLPLRDKTYRKLYLAEGIWSIFSLFSSHLVLVSILLLLCVKQFANSSAIYRTCRTPELLYLQSCPLQRSTVSARMLHIQLFILASHWQC